MVICRHRTRREGIHEPVLAHRDVQGERCRAVRVPEGSVHGAAESAYSGRLREAAPLEAYVDKGRHAAKLIARLGSDSNWLKIK
jgi:hypothetical protein